MREIKEFDTVLINGQDAVVKEICDSGQTAVPKAIIIQNGQTYSVGLNDLTLKSEINNGDS